MRRVPVYLVMECSGDYDCYGEYPVMAFQSEETANRCIEVRTAREKMAAEVDARNKFDNWHEDRWYRMDGIEVVLDA